MEKLLNQLEKKVRAGIMSIKNGKLTPKEAGLGKMLNALKPLDEVLHTELMIKYKDAIKK